MNPIHWTVCMCMCICVQTRERALVPRTYRWIHWFHTIKINYSLRYSSIFCTNGWTIRLPLDRPTETRATSWSKTLMLKQQLCNVNMHRRYISNKCSSFKPFLLWSYHKKFFLTRWKYIRIKWSKVKQNHTDKFWTHQLQWETEQN